jgi:WD40 repeat protein
MVDGSGVTLAPGDDRYHSMAEMRAAHGDLLDRRRRLGEDTPEFLDAVEVFIRRAQGTGALLHADEERWSGQSLLDYWANFAYRAGRQTPDATLAEFDPALAPELPDSLRPYLGLDAFVEADRERLFGRDRLIAELVDRVRDHRMVAVAGPSGSGKSSLVQAGLLPVLKAGALPGSADWHYYPPMVPGSDPLVSLARVVRPAGADPAEWTSTHAEFLRDPAHLWQVVSGDHDAPAVIVVDQFEEVFTVGGDEPKRVGFIDNLVHLVEAPGARHTVILTIRSDFESYVTRLPALQALFDRATVRVTPLNATELREAIEKPAQRIGLKFEEGIVDALVREMLGEPAALPLLQFTLLKLWESRTHNLITWDAYRRLGGGRSALSKSADTFYQGLIPEEQLTARRILLRLVRPGEGLEVTSNRVRRASLYQAGEARDRVDRVLEKLLHARLLRLTHGDDPADDQVEVAHEALVRNWPTLVNWLDDERVRMRQRLRLTAAADQWRALQRDPSVLLRGPLMDEASRYYDVNELEAEFIRASRAAIEDAEREKEAARQRELDQARALAEERQRVAEAERRRAEEQSRAARRLRAQRVVLIASLLVASFFAGVWYLQRTKAESLFVLSDARRLAGETTSLLGARLDLALLLGAEAARRYDNPVTRGALLRALEYDPRVVTFLDVKLPPDARRAGGVVRPVFHPSGRTLAAAVGNTIVRWNVASRTALPPLRGHRRDVSGLAFSLDGRLLASGSNDMTVILWDVEGGVETARFTDQARPSLVYTVAFSPDGRLVASAGADGIIRLWDIATRSLSGTLSGHESSVYSVAFTRDGRFVVSGSEDGTVLLWDLATRRRVRALAGSQATVHSVAVSRGGRLASGSADGTVHVWDLASGRLLRTLTGHGGRVNSVAFSPDGTLLASAGDDRRVIVWDMGKGVPVGDPLTGHTLPVSGVAFSPDGSLLASGGQDTFVVLSTPGSSDARLSRTIASHTTDVLNVAFSPDGRLVASGGADQNVLVRVVVGNGAQQMHSPLEHRADVVSLSFSPDGLLLASASEDDTITLWDVATGKRVRSWKTATAQRPVRSIAFSPKGTMLASVSGDATIRLWDITTGAQAGAPMKVEGDDVECKVTFSPDGARLASICGGKSIVLWDVAGRKQVRTLDAPDDVYAIAFGPDGKLLAAGDSSGTIVLWDAGRGRQTESLHTPQSHAVHNLAISADGRTLASGHADGAVILWDLDALQRIDPPLVRHESQVWSVAFSPRRPDGGTLVASGSADGRVILSDVTFARWPVIACRIAGRDLTEDEWKRVGAVEYRRTCTELLSTR